jgi:hypothetical protein
VVALSRLLSGLVYGVPLLDPLTFVGVPALLGLISVVACAARGQRRPSHHAEVRR